MSKMLYKICLLGRDFKTIGKLGWIWVPGRSSSNPERGLRPPISDPTISHKVSHSHKLLCQPHRNLDLLEALHQLIDKNAVELVQNQTSLGFFNRLFLVTKPNNKWRLILDLSKLNHRFRLKTCLGSSSDFSKFTSQPSNPALMPHRNLTHLNLHAWLLEPQQSRSRASPKQWQQELRLLKGDPPDQSMRQSGPFLQSGASLIRWTSGHPL